MQIPQKNSGSITVAGVDVEIPFDGSSIWIVRGNASGLSFNLFVVEYSKINTDKICTRNAPNLMLFNLIVDKNCANQSDCYKYGYVL